MNYFYEGKAQGAIEYLLIIGAAILIVAIVILAVTGILSSGQESVGASQKSVERSFDVLKESSGNYLNINGDYYLKSSSSAAFGVVALYHFDGSVAEMLKDSSGNGNDLGFTSAALPVSSQGINGGNAFTFSHGNPGNYIANVNTVKWKFSGSSTKSFSLSGWFRPSACDFDYGGISLAGTVNFRIALYTQQGAGNGWWMQIRACQHDDCGWRNGGICKLGVWQNIVGVYDSSVNTLYVYQDGNKVSEIKPNLGSSVNTSNLIDSISVGNAQEVFSGEIDEVVIWDRAVSSAEVKSLYDNSLNPNN